MNIQLILYPLYCNSLLLTEKGTYENTSFVLLKVLMQCEPFTANFYTAYYTIMFYMSFSEYKLVSLFCLFCISLLLTILYCTMLLTIYACHGDLSLKMGDPMLICGYQQSSPLQLM